MKACPDDLGTELTKAIRNAATLWFHSPLRPQISPDVLHGWSALLQGWLADSSLPMLVRSSKGPPGSLIDHPNGRRLVPTDNSPAQWVFTLAERGEVPTLDQIHRWFAADRIPVAMAIKKKDKPDTKYFCNLATVKDNPNDLGWKVAHIEAVGLRRRGKLDAMSIKDLESHFVRFLAPSNLFVVPTRWAGFSEIDEVIELFRTNCRSSD